MHLLIMLLVTLLIMQGLSINLLPCTEHITAAEIQIARDILEESTPPGYRLENLFSEVTTGRNPHRWTGEFSRNDNLYNCGCVFLTSVKKDFKRTCPAGSEIRVIRIRTGNNPRILVEFLVNCYCTNIPQRKKRSVWSSSTPCRWSGYTTEKAVCS